MRKTFWRGTVIFFIVSIFLNVILITWLFWKQTFSGSSAGIVKGAYTLNVKSINVGDPIDVLNLPRRIDSWNLLEEKWKWFFADDGVKRPLLYDSHDVSFVHLSPSHQRLGFFFYPENHSLGEIILAVLDIDRKVVKEVYRGDTWTSNWEWKGDNALIVKRSCGTGCMNASVINVSTGKKIEEYRVY